MAAPADPLIFPVHDALLSRTGHFVPVSKTTAYTAKSGELVMANATGGAFTVTLPAATLGATVVVKRMNAGVNAVTVAPAAGTIDGAASVSLGAQYQAATVVADGSNWVTI